MIIRSFSMNFDVQLVERSQKTLIRWAAKELQNLSMRQLKYIVVSNVCARRVCSLGVYHFYLISALIVANSETLSQLLPYRWP